MTSAFRRGAWYLGHVIAPVVFGERFAGDDLAARSLVLGVLALAVFAVLWLLASRRARTDMLSVLVCTVASSVLAHLGPRLWGHRRPALRRSSGARPRVRDRGAPRPALRGPG
jgi:hypothetical protein